MSSGPATGAAVMPPGFTPTGTPDLDSPERPGAMVGRGGVRFEVWAPGARSVEVVIDPDGSRIVHPLDCPAPGETSSTWSATVPGIGHGTRYRYRLSGAGHGATVELADPASRHQPDGVEGTSAVVDLARYGGTSATWSGPELVDTVLYELHVGTFTPGGTLDSAAAELPRLVELGVSTVELMPLAQFSGERGWGYDGVFPNAVQHSYGGPDALARFVTAAHDLGLAVVLDVVYNHFGPEGDVTRRFGPYVTDAHVTPWGGAVNLSGPGSDQVRRLFLDNARQWIADFGLDGLRLDAVHAIVDPTSRPFLEELNTAVHRIGHRQGRSVLTFAESSDNDPRLVLPEPVGVGSDAVWDDEYHHALRVALTGDRDGYYADFSGIGDVAEVLEHRWAYRGRYSSVRRRRHGRDAVDLDDAAIPANRFVVFDQNHDQVGNRRDGERLDVLVDLERRELALAAVLLSPFTPLLFMGEEYGERAPFPYFVDHRDPELLDAVRRGRAAEFVGFGWQGEPPDPGSIDTFRAAVLHPEVAIEEPHASLLALTTELLRLRRERPTVHNPAATSIVERDGATVSLRRSTDAASTLLALRFAEDAGTVGLQGHRVLLVTGAARRAGPDAAGSVVNGDIARVPAWSALFAATG